MLFRGSRRPDGLQLLNFPLETHKGDWDEVFAVIKAATDAVGAFGTRVSLVLKADIRPGHTGELTGKVERLEAAIQRAVTAD